MQFNGRIIRDAGMSISDQSRGYYLPVSQKKVHGNPWLNLNVNLTQQAAGAAEALE